MTTKRDLLLQAAEEFGVGRQFNIPAEKLQNGLSRLDNLAAEWDGIGIRVGYDMGAGLDDESGIPDTARNAFVQNLAVNWASAFGKAVSPDTRRGATQGFNRLYSARQVRPQTQLPAHLPRGQGSRRVVMEPQYFQPSDDVPGLNEGATEY